LEMFLKFIVALAGLCVLSAHICMWSPPQRSGAQIQTPGESACYLKVGPCGNVASSTPGATLQGGKNFNILFQQNLNHYYIQNPGKLVADFANAADPTEADFTELGSIHDYNAMNEITQTNFTLSVPIPNVDCEHCVLRMRYISNNPTENDRGMIFYQCADVKVEKSVADEAKVVLPVVETKSSVNEVKHDCCAAKQFTMQAYETSSWRNPTQKLYYFDAARQLFRIDTISGNGNTTRDGSFRMFNNFTSGIEYYHNVATDSCDLYGLNYWSDWCYGAANNQVYYSSITVGNDLADIWRQEGENDVFSWTNTRDSCVPVAQSRQDTGETTFYYNFKEEVPLASVFELPAACVRAEANLKGSVKQLAPRPSHHSIY